VLIFFVDLVMFTWTIWNKKLLIWLLIWTSAKRILKLKLQPRPIGTRHVAGDTSTSGTQKFYIACHLSRLPCIQAGTINYRIVGYLSKQPYSFTLYKMEKINNFRELTSLKVLVLRIKP